MGLRNLLNNLGKQTIEYNFEHTWQDRVRDANLSADQAIAQVRQVVNNRNMTASDQLAALEVLGVTTQKMNHGDAALVRAEIIIAGERALANAGKLDSAEVDTYERQARAEAQQEKERWESLARTMGWR